MSNFNNSKNLQGTGTTIVRVTPQGQTSVFYQGPPGVGLSTALGVLQAGYVVVGAVPSTDGTSATVGMGSLLILDKNGKVVANMSDPAMLDGPWDLTINDMGSQAQIFVSDVLSGTVSRFNVSLPAGGTPQVASATQIASGYKHRGDPAAFELGPTGLAYNADDRHPVRRLHGRQQDLRHRERRHGGDPERYGQGRLQGQGPPPRPARPDLRRRRQPDRGPG